MKKIIQSFFRYIELGLPERAFPICVRRNIVILTFLFLITGFVPLLSVPAFAVTGETDVIILQNDRQGISLRYVTPTAHWSLLQVDQHLYRTPYVKNTGTIEEEGAPQLPVRVIWLVIPPEASPSLTGAVPYSVNVSADVPAPVPTIAADENGFATEVYTEDPQVYSSLSPFPANWVEIQGPENYRNLQVIRLLIYPFRFPSTSGGTMSLDSIDVTVSFAGGKVTQPGFLRPLEDEYLGRLISNWSGEAKNWTIPKSPQIAGVASWPSGNTYKITLDESGIYRLTYFDLLGAGIDPSGINPDKICIFNNGGRTLPQSVTAPRSEQLEENAILVHDGNDDSFDQGDEVWFYGKSVHEWEWNQTLGRFVHYQNPYMDENVYWLSFDPSGPDGLRMATLGQTGTAWLNPPNSRTYAFEEKELYAIYSQWDLPLYMPNLYGDIFSGSSASRTFNIYLEAVETAAPATLYLEFKPTGTYEVRLNGEIIATISSSSATVSIPAGLLNSGNNSLYLKHNSSGTSYLDHYEIHYTRELTATSNHVDFVSPDADGFAQFSIEGLSDPWIFDITDYEDVAAINAASFKDSSDASNPRRYIAINESALMSPTAIELDQRNGDEYVNLRSALGADVLVITADEFYDAMFAYEDYREVSAPDNFEVLRVRVSDIFDEFGWGLRDPVAIRDFVKSSLPIYNWVLSPLYILFVGDGDFDYKNNIASGDANWVIPYEDGSTCTDDFYTCFTASGGPCSSPALSTGRWTARSVSEVEEMIARLIEYESEPTFGPWRNRAVFVADDEYENGVYYTKEEAHVKDTELLVESYMPGFINSEKIYLTEYPGEKDPAGGGTYKPGATSDLIDNINDGCLMVNYVGHGNPTVWSHENVFQQSRDLPLINNGSRLPLFLAFTCDWAYWDKPAEQSMPEEMIYMANGGAIAAIAATRVTSSGANAALAFNFYSELFSQPTGIRLGDALMLAKTNYTTSNSEKYHLLGDPVMKLALPQLNVYIDSNSVDTLVALGSVTLSGEIQTQGGALVPDFEGVTHLQVFDSRVLVTYAFDNDSSFTTYILPGNLIFRGDVTAHNGLFDASFIVPVDIGYGGDDGRFSVYAYSDETDGAGVKSGVIFGESVVALQDTIPPLVSVYFDSPGFRDGDPIGNEATLFVEVIDSNGVNITGSAGHGIVVTIDGSIPFDLTDSFSYELDSHTSGRAEYKISAGEISPGLHNAEAIAWDVANNPNIAQVSFEVTGWEEFRVTDVLNYPNPFNNYTRFTFVLAGSGASGANVSIKIYTVAGRLVKVIDGIIGNDSFNYDDPALVWNGRDEEGDLLSNGVYIYKVKAVGLTGNIANETGKLIVMR
ncbi:hypothetical protein CEE37_04345 [candidate division LCP-89 bacterium B3_LCP]|uniref:Gingipain domain-containing protein n=1 Tax=candidate division LCP-89 bacterium B3_LCP TaxID=2012998 RepID=A0A532V3L1_UNCL8|nr:MAG: hypothetical protein CEE37_04345 [candidate division LCP-89 bacterium B3_LCP]